MTDHLGQRLASLSPDRIQALVKKLNESGGGTGPTVGHMPRNQQQHYPLSGAQERIWFLTQLSPDSSSAFNNPGALRATREEPLNAHWMEEAVKTFSLRHEILRTTFHADGGRPYQRVHKKLAPAFSWRDLRELPPKEREHQAMEIARAEGLRRFVLDTGPLFAFTVVQVGDKEYLLLNTTHHIVSDGWSNAMLGREISAIYGALAASAPDPLPNQKFQYIDFVGWEREWLNSAAADGQRERWTGRLSFEAPLELPADHPRPAVMTHRGGLETARLAPALNFRIKEFARAERANTFHVLMATFHALLFRYTGQEIVTVGTQTANRDTRAFQNVFGLFANTVVTRTTVNGDKPFRIFLGEVRTVCQNAVQDQSYPFERLVGELNPSRSLNSHPVFQVMLVHQNVPSLYEVPGMRLEVLKIDYGLAKFDLNLWTEDIGDGLTLTLHYSKDVFAAATVRRMLDHYQSMLESVIANPDCAVGSLEYFDTEISAPRPAVVAAPPAPPSLHRQFEAQVARTPYAMAAEGADTELNYEELNARANQLARHLVKAGASRGEPVALLLPRSPELLVGVLAVWKMGSPFVALDPINPPHRMAAMLRDAEANFLLSDSAVDVGLGEILEIVTAINLDECADAVGAQDPANLTGDQGLDEEGGQLAYIVYTSGSTGAPKGIEVEHGHLAHYCEGIWAVMGLGAGDRFATVTSAAADLGYTMLFPPLLNGGCVVLVPEKIVTDAVALAEYFGRRPVDCLKIVPAHLRALMGPGQSPALLPRMLLVLGGETCLPELIREIRNVSPALRILNHYGPSETTVGVLAYEVPSNESFAASTVPLGFPIGGACAYVLDGQRQPVPDGIHGEIFIGGPTVARGYLNRPDWTAEKFQADPWTLGERLYRSGDRGRKLENGAIEFLGRADRQIKIRGFRVDLEEIEQVILSHADVEQAVVLGPHDKAPTSRISAYVRRRAGSEIGAQTMTRYLKSRLPGYMIPNSFAFPDAIPLTPNGKIDRGALAQSKPEAEKFAGGAPRDTWELELLKLWQDVLEIEKIGIDDGFFELGGHSLLAVRLMAAIHQKFGRSIPLSAMFEYGSIRRLADLLRADADAPAATPLVSIQPKGKKPPCFFVHPAGGNVLCYYDLARCLGTEIPFWGLQAALGEGGVAPGSIAKMAEIYLEAMLDIVHDGVPILGGWSMGALAAFEMARLFHQRTGVAPIVAVLDQIAPDLTSDSTSGSEDLTAKLFAFANKVSELVGHDIGLSKELLAASSMEETNSLFLDKFKAFELAPEATRVEEFQGFLKLMLDHNRITGEYEGGLYPGRVLVFRAEGKMSGSTSGPGRLARRPDLGWQQHTAQPVQVIPVPGSHISMIRPPHVQALADAIVGAI
jgi:amino acid adenylation domain-containing protein